MPVRLARLRIAAFFGARNLFRFGAIWPTIVRALKRHQCRAPLILGSLIIIAAFCAPDSALAANVHFRYVNPLGGAPWTNSFRIQACGSNVLADGSPPQTVGLPLRLFPDTNGEVIATNLQINWYKDLDHNIIFQVDDSSSTLYDVTNLWQSGFNLFVVRRFGTNPPPNFNQITNALGYQPAQFSDTNGFIRLVQATNVATAFTLASSNSLYSDYTTKIAVVSALIGTTSNFLYGDYTTKIAAVTAAGITNIYPTNLAGVLIVGHRAYIGTNYEAPGSALAIGLQATNFTMAVSNALSAQITAGGVNASTATNIAAFQAQGVTNGFIAKLDATNIFNAKFLAPSNTLAALSVTNAYGTNLPTVLYTGQRLYIPTNWDVAGAAVLKMATNNGISWNQNLLNPSANFSNLFSLKSSYPVIYDDNSGLMLLTNAQGNYMSIDLPGDEIDFVGGGIITAFNLDMTLGAPTINVGTAMNLNNNSAVIQDRFGTLIVNGARLANFNTVSNTGIYYGNGAGLTNLPISAISTNGSTALQIHASVGGVSVWTNVTTALGYTPPTLAQTTNIAAGQVGIAAGITNAYGTNLPNGLVTGQRIYFPTNFDTLGGSNFLFGRIGVTSNFLATSTGTASNFLATSSAASSNFLQLEKVNATNGAAFGLTASNTALMGNVSFGPSGLATNIIGNTTNYLFFINAGSGVATNGALVWHNTLGVYTNWQNGSILTNNGSAWLYQTNGVTLYSLSGASPVGTYSAISGALPAPTAVYTAAINDHMVMLGYFSVSNLQATFTNIFTNAIGIASNNAIANAGGFGTNTRLYSLTGVWNWPEQSISASGGLSFNFASAASGQANTNNGSGFGAAILSGATNRLLLDGGGVIAGGIWNTLSGGAGNADVIVGGSWNGIVGSAGISSIDANFLGGGFSNNIASVSAFSFLGGGLKNKLVGSYAVNLGGTANTNVADGSVILGGATNSVTGAWSIAAGRNVKLSNDNSFAWSDGTIVTSTVPNQFLIAGSNGLSVLVGGITVTNFNTNTAVQAVGVTATGALTTNGVPGGGGGGSGTVTSVAQTVPQGFAISGSPVTTSGTLAITRSGGNDNYLGGGATNIGRLEATNLTVYGGFTNASLTASTLLQADANKKIISIANPTVSSVLTNLNGVIGYAPLLDASALTASAHIKTGATTNLISSEDATGYTNTVAHTHAGTSTNLTATFNGTLQSYTVTNGPDIWFNFAGANGSVSYRITAASFSVLHFPYVPTWLAGSNSVVTNGVLSLTSYGGTNAAQLVVSLREKQ